jgi:hypothetical protein
MKAIVVLVAVLSMTIVAGANVSTFDDLAPADWVSGGHIYNGYDGFNWDQFGFIHKDALPGTGFTNGTVSGNFASFNEYSNVANVATVNDGQFNFVGAYFTSAYNDNNQVTVTGYRNDLPIYLKTITTNTSGPVWGNFLFLGVDKLTFASDNFQFAMDDFTYNTSVVPVPGALILGMVGVGLVGWVKKRFA